MKSKRILLILFVLMFCLVSCQDNNLEVMSKPNRPLNILSGLNDEDNVVREDFTYPYEVAKNVDVEWITLPYELIKDEDSHNEKLYEILKESLTGSNPPDVLLLTADQLVKLIHDGFVQPLDPFMKKDSSFDLDLIAPTVLEGMRSLGKGQVFALPISFWSEVLIYNKDLFDLRGVEYPKDDMTWDEILQLAQKVTFWDNSRKIFGFAFTYHQWDNLYYFMDIYASPIGLRYISEDQKTVTIDTKDWQNVWETFIDIEKQGIMPVFQMDHSFYSGNIAMTIINYKDVVDLIDWQNRDTENKPTFDWDLVTLPTHPSAPRIGGKVDYHDLLAINVHSENPQLAWDFISFMLGENYQKVMFKNPHFGLPARIDAIPQYDKDIHVQPFYVLKPAGLRYDIPFGAPHEITELGRNYYQRALIGALSIEEALQQFQREAQQILDEINLSKER